MKTWKASLINILNKVSTRLQSLKENGELKASPSNLTLILEVDEGCLRECEDVATGNGTMALRSS